MALVADDDMIVQTQTVPDRAGLRRGIEARRRRFPMGGEAKDHLEPRHFARQLDQVSPRGYVVEGQGGRAVRDEQNGHAAGIMVPGKPIRCGQHRRSRQAGPWGHLRTHAACELARPVSSV